MSLNIYSTYQVSFQVSLLQNTMYSALGISPTCMSEKEFLQNKEEKKKDGRMVSRES